MHKPNVTFKEEIVNNYKNCFLKFFSITYAENDHDYNRTISKMGMILMNPHLYPELNQMIKKYGIKDKNRFLVYIMSKAIEINCYRKGVNGIERGLENIGLIRDKDDLLVTPTALNTIINDALFYILSTNKLYQQDVVNSELKTNFQKSLYKMSPIFVLEHLNTLLEEPTGKELLLETIKESIIIVFERKQFAANNQPSINSMKDFMRRRPFPSDFTYEVLHQFNSRLKITEEESDYKVAMCEMIYSVLSKKETTTGMSFGEYNLLKKLKSCPKTRKDLSNLYDKCNGEIIGFFTNHFDSFNELKNEGLLEDQDEFSGAKRK